MGRLRELRTEKEFLEQYDIDRYDHPSVTADTVVMSVRELPSGNLRKSMKLEMSVLLIRRGAHPFKGSWALPGGFFRKGETLEECAARELREETALEAVKIVPLGIFSKPGRDPRGWIISAAYLSVVGKSAAETIRGGDDAAEARWFPVQEVLDGRIRLAFDHLEMVTAAVERLRRVDRDELAFSFLPREFTLAELQYVYEFLENRELTGPNFRRRMMPGLVQVEGFLREDGGHRPAALFRRVLRE